jgi:hypothetical protein
VAPVRSSSIEPFHTRFQKKKKDSTHFSSSHTQLIKMFSRRLFLVSAAAGVGAIGAFKVNTKIQVAQTEGKATGPPTRKGTIPSRPGGHTNFTMAEYVWLDANQEARSKTKVRFCLLFVL